MEPPFSVLIWVAGVSGGLVAWTVPFDLTIFQYYSSKAQQCWSLSALDLNYPTGGGYAIARPIVAPAIGLYSTILFLKSGAILYWNAPASAEFDMWIQASTTSVLGQ